MATGNYGTIRPADPTVEDIEILYCYSPDREDLGSLKLLPFKSCRSFSASNGPQCGYGGIRWVIYSKITNPKVWIERIL